MVNLAIDILQRLRKTLEQLIKSIFFFKDTNRNLRQVDQMLGQYREYSNGQAGAIEHVRMFTYVFLFSYISFWKAVVEK